MKLAGKFSILFTFQDDEKLVRTLVNLLTEEEQNLGLSIPDGIGQRPKHLVS